MVDKVEVENDGYILHWCPGCEQMHGIDIIEKNLRGAIWSWNHNKEMSTFTPSINIIGQCHYFITDGKIIYCADSTHSLAGQTVELPDYPF